MVSGLVLGLAFLCGCGGSGASGGGSTATVQTSAPAINTVTNSNLQNGAVLVTLSNTEAGAQLYYTVDGSTPTSASTPYEAPFLVASNLTVKAIAQNGTETASNVTSQTFSPGIASGTLVWSDEFANSTGANAQPNTAAWKYQTGADVNSSVDIHCAYGSSSSPCSTAYPNSFVGTDGYLHILAQQPSAGVYTAARMQTNGLFSFQYGRLEARIWVPEGQGIWPAFWLEGNNSATVGWPACGEMDVMERVNAATSPDWNEGSIHGTGFTGSNLGTLYDFPTGQTAAGWHTYGMIWQKGSVAYYIDNPSTPYVTYTPSSISGFSGAAWPFDAGPSFVILNLAVGGSWPGSPNASTVFPAQMLVDYVRIYTN